MGVFHSKISSYLRAFSVAQLVDLATTKMWVQFPGDTKAVMYSTPVYLLSVFELTRILNE